VACGSLKIQDARHPKNLQAGHHHTNLSGYMFATKARIDSHKKILLNSNTSSRRFHNMANFGPLTAEIGLAVCGTQLTYGFRILATLLHGTLV